MTRPGSRPPRTTTAATAAAMSGAVDLSALKAKAAAKNAPPPPKAGNGATVIVAVTELDFEQNVVAKSAEVPVIVNLASPRSPQSLRLTASLEKLVVEDGGSWILANVDVDTSPRIAQAFGVQAVPTLVAVAAGQPLADLSGDQPEESLRQWLDAIARAVDGKLAGPAAAGPAEEPDDPRFVAAETALAAGDLDAADRAFTTILDAEPGNRDALNGVRQVRFLARVVGQAPDAIDQADADPKHVEKGLAAADALMYAQRTEEAFERIITLVKVTAADERATAKARLLELFELFDAADPRVVSARRKLAAALF